MLIVLGYYVILGSIIKTICSVVVKLRYVGTRNGGEYRLRTRVFRQAGHYCVCLCKTVNLWVAGGVKWTRHGGEGLL